MSQQTFIAYIHRSSMDQNHKIKITKYLIDKSCNIQYSSLTVDDKHQCNSTITVLWIKKNVHDLNHGAKVFIDSSVILKLRLPNRTTYLKLYVAQVIYWVIQKIIQHYQQHGMCKQHRMCGVCSDRSACSLSRPDKTQVVSDDQTTNYCAVWFIAYISSTFFQLYYMYLLYLL